MTIGPATGSVIAVVPAQEGSTRKRLDYREVAMESNAPVHPTVSTPVAEGTAPELVLCNAMRPARTEPVAGLAYLAPMRRFRLGTLLTGLMLASYLATISGLAVFFCGVFLATENVASGAAFAAPAAEVARTNTWDDQTPSQQLLDRDFARYPQQVAARHTW